MGKHKHSIFNQLFLGLSILLLLGNGILGALAYKRSESALFRQIQSNVENIAQCAAANVSGDILKEIEVGEEDTENYATIIDELALFRDNTELEYIYTLRKTEDGRFLFVVDSDPEEPASIGDECEYTEALDKAFSEQKTMADDEAFSDEWGMHVSAYSPIFHEGAVVGAVGVDFSANWVEEQMVALRNLVIVICVITYGVSVVILLLLVSKFKRSMGKLNKKVEELAGGSGDLTKEIDIYSKDEFGTIASNLNAFIGQIRTLVKEVSQSTKEILETGEEVNSTVTDNVKVMSGMNAEIEDITADMEKSSDSSKVLSQNLAESASQMASFAKNVEEMCGIVQQVNENAREASVTARTDRENALELIGQLQDKVKKTSSDAQKIQQVKQIAEDIGGIAEQTRMLSLNAQIEAARAGAMGAGFSVVAEEVGRLSGDIDRAVAEINQINQEVLSALEAWTGVSEEMILFISGDVVKIYDAFAELGEEFGNTTDTIRGQMVEIGEQSTEITRSISEINTDVQEITSTVIRTAESANNLAQSTGKISESLEALNATTQKNVQNSGKLSEQVSGYNF